MGVEVLQLAPLAYSGVPEDVLRIPELVSLSELVYEEVAGGEVVAVGEAVDHALGSPLSGSRMMDENELAGIGSFTFFLRAWKGLSELEHAPMIIGY